MGILIGICLIAALLIWRARPRGRVAKDGDDGEPEIDHDELEAAEREVKDLDVHQDPEEGFQGDDWGPGATPPPKQR